MTQTAASFFVRNEILLMISSCGLPKFHEFHRYFKENHSIFYNSHWKTGCFIDFSWKINCLIDFSMKISDFHKFRMVRHSFFHDFLLKIIDVLKILLEISFLTIKCNHGWVPLQSASWALLPTSFAPNTLKSQMPITHHQQ